MYSILDGLSLGFRYFEKEQFKENTSKVGYVSPEVVQFIKLCEGTCLLTSYFHAICLYI